MPVYRTSLPTDADAIEHDNPLTRRLVDLDQYIVDTLVELPDPTTAEDGSTAFVVEDASLWYVSGADWLEVTGTGSGAPTDVDYLVGTADSGLSNEIAVGTSPGGELGGTWASPTVDTTHSGSSHAGSVTFSNLDANGDVGTGSSQVAAGDHTHVGGASVTYLDFMVRGGD